MAVFGTFLQGTTGSSSGAVTPVVSTAFGASLTVGSLIVVTTADDSGTLTGVTGVTDSAGNTYTQIFAKNGTSSIQMWFTNVRVGGAGVTVNVAWNTGSTPGVTFAAQEFSGFGAAKVDSYIVSAPTTSTAPSSGATQTPTVSSSLIVGGGIHAGVVGAWTLGSGYTNLNTVDVANRSMAQESKIVSSKQAQTTAFTIASSLEWLCAAVIFNSGIPNAKFNNSGIRPHLFSPGLAR